jgi:DNA-directed RNA polymerase specialized sigma24 family protein
MSTACRRAASVDNDGQHTPKRPLNRRRYTRRVTTERGHGQFTTTRWSMVLAAGRAGGQDGDLASDSARHALTTLCETYWYPLYAFLRSHGHSAADAEDATQAFFARLLEKQTLRHADPDRGRFRSFMLASLTHFVANERDKQTAKKRGGGVPPLELEFERAEGRFQLEPATDETPETLFDRRWALSLLERVLARLRAEMIAGGKELQFERLKTYLIGDQPQLSYADNANALSMTEGAIKVAVHRLRRRYRDLVRDEILQTVSSPDQIEDELHHLWASVAVTPGGISRTGRT